MIERLEVEAGPGTVVRYGGVVAWAGASASPSLVSFLVASARNLAPSLVGGDQLADHLEEVLGRRDPEPDVPFVAIGPGEDGWTALLHGAVQVWDGSGWTVPAPERGWLRARLWPRPTLSVSVSGTAVPSPSPDSMLDLGAGVAPGGGFVLVPVVAQARFAAAGSTIGDSEPTTVIAAPDSGLPTEVLSFGETPEAGHPVEETPVPAEPPDEAAAGHPDLPEDDGPDEGAGGEPDLPEDEAAQDEPDQATPDEATPDEAAPEGAAPDEAAPDGAAQVAPIGAGAGPQTAPAGVVDLRSAEARSRVVAYPPLPPAGDAPRAVAGAPVVSGAPCPRGHLNRPGMPACARCGQPVSVELGYQVSGTRPALGCLITDEGAVYRLDSGYLIGSDPARDPTVRGRLARPLLLPGDDVAASHAEIRLHDWDVIVTDRASDGGTHVFPPGAPAWERIGPYDPRVLPPGTHVAFGQRVVTFLSPWNMRTAAPAPDVS